MQKTIEQQLHDEQIERELKERNAQALRDYAYRRLIHLYGVEDFAMFHVKQPSKL